MIPDLQAGRPWPVDTRNPINRSHPLNRGRLAWWLTLPHLAGGRQWYDLMGKYKGVLTSLTGATAGWRGTTRPGGWGNMVLDGTGYLTVADAGDTLATDFVTVAAWVKASNAYSGFGSVINRRTAGNSLGWSLQNNGDTLFFFISATGGNTSSGTATLTASVWYHVVATYDGVGPKMYTNGTLSSSNPVASGVLNRPASTVVSIGRNEAATGNLFAGAVDDVCVWNRALSATEIKRLYDTSRAGYPGAINRLAPATLGVSGGLAGNRRRRVLLCEGG